jgi:TfoX/Sxy family transcriptional regulator of competence genes
LIPPTGCLMVKLMENKTPTRTQEQINQEYTNLAARLGDMIVKRDMFNAELEATHKAMVALTQEKPLEVKEPEVVAPEAAQSV